MYKSVLRITPAALMLAGVALACNFPRPTPVPPLPIEISTSLSAGKPAPTIFALIGETSTPTLALTDTATLVPTPQNPLVLRATLCWVGPGSKYEVVSSLKQGERVELLGRGSITGWYVVKNPIYRDPCWVAESDLQIEAGTDITNLRVFVPPPTPTPTPKPTKVPSPTPTP